MPGKYATPQAFRHALYDRLRQQALREGTDLQRLQRSVAFERLLARLFDDGLQQPWVLKGGYSLELRLRDVARATVDLDLSIPTPNPNFSDLENWPRAVRETLQVALERDLDDTFTFFLSNSEIELQGPTYGGIRFTVDARILDTTFAKFHLDVAIGDLPIPEPDWIVGQEFS